MAISVCILTKNSAATLRSTLESTRRFGEVVLFDTGSTDRTIEIAQEYSNVRVVEGAFIGFGPLRNKVASLATHDWILALDSDEVIQDPDAILARIGQLDSGTIYAFERHNFFNNKRIYGCGWGRDVVRRLYHRRHAQFQESLVHEAIHLPNLPCVTLPTPLLHTPYRGISDFLVKMEHYSTLFAQERQSKSSLSRAIGHGLFAFFRSYLFQRGILDGKEGFIISAYNAQTTYYKHLKEP
ncbi:MAG: lipopolysaccharide core biosynthesis glycosyltransferase waaE [Chlamydiota bacterium]|jgi:glycosyltransferase involved in cell wall biosynthesis